MILIQELACFHVEVEGSTAITLTQCGQRVLKRMPTRSLKHGTRRYTQPKTHVDKGLQERVMLKPRFRHQKNGHIGDLGVLKQLLLRNQKLNQKSSLNLKIPFFAVLINPKFFFRSYPIYIPFQRVDRFAEFLILEKIQSLFFLRSHFSPRSLRLKDQTPYQPSSLDIPYKTTLPLGHHSFFLGNLKKMARFPSCCFMTSLLKPISPPKSTFRAYRASLQGPFGDLMAIWTFRSDS